MVNERSPATSPPGAGPGKPVQNAFIESFNGRFREECLNTHWFTNLADAEGKIAAWREDYKLPPFSRFRVPVLRRRMDFNQIRYVLALANTLNFTRAAEKCYVSQPALTQAIKRLEDELDGELIRRDGRNTELTELGKSLRGHFEQIDRTRHLVRNTAKAFRSGEIAELNIGVMCTIGPRVLGGMLDAFQMDHPMVSIVLHDVTPEAIADLLLSGALDASFCARHGPPNRHLSYVDLFEEAMVIAFPPGHEFEKMDAVPLLAIAEQRYVDRLHCEFRQEFFEYFKEQGIEPEVTFRSQREDWIQSLVLDGMGVSMIPRYSLLRPEVDNRPVTGPVLSRRVQLALAGESQATPALEAFIKQAKNQDWPAAESLSNPAG